LTAIPVEIGNLPGIRYLYIGKNALETLPVTLGNLVTLVELDLAKCGPMTEIPESLCKLRNLEVVYIDVSLLIPGCLQGRMGYFQLIVKD
jgi:leucine-rich repeat protein SHOC2